jgi:hypothetical protein
MTFPESDLDLWSDQAILDPYPLYRELRDTAPAAWLARHGMVALPRYTDDFQLDGVTLSQGQRVVVLFASANRDERKWDDPERFDVRRKPWNQGVGRPDGGAGTAVGVVVAAAPGYVAGAKPAPTAEQRQAPPRRPPWMRHKNTTLAARPATQAGSGTLTGRTCGFRSSQRPHP